MEEIIALEILTQSSTLKFSKGRFERELKLVQASFCCRHQILQTDFVGS